MKPNHNQRGEISIYIALLVVITITSAAIVMSGVLARQVRFTSDVVNTERAFYASDSGIEATLFDLKAKVDSGDTSVSSTSASIPYDDRQAQFSAKGKLGLTEDQSRVVPCVNSQGDFQRETRNTATGPEGCTVE